MNEAKLSRHQQQTEQRAHLEEIAYYNVCALCASSLLVYWDGKVGDFKIRCTQNKRHKVNISLRSIIEQWRTGDSLPVEVAQALEHKYGKEKVKGG